MVLKILFFLNCEFQRSAHSRISPMVPMPEGSTPRRTAGLQENLHLIPLAKHKVEGTKWACPPWQCSSTEGEVDDEGNLL